MSYIGSLGSRRGIVTAQLICIFVFEYANHWFSHAKAHLFLIDASWMATLLRKS